MFMASMDLWDIVDKSKKILHSNTNFKVRKQYQKHMKKAMSIIGLNLMNKLRHIQSGKKQLDV